MTIKGMDETTDQGSYHTVPFSAGTAETAEPLFVDDDDVELAVPSTNKNKSSLEEAASMPVAEPILDAPVVAVRYEDKEVRMAFIRKVYSILALQILVTGCISAFMIFHKPTQNFVLNHLNFMNFWIFVSLASVIALRCYKDVHPHNIIILSIFTLAESFLIGTVTTIYCAVGYKGVVLEAVFLTCAVFIGLTLFTFQSKIDFSFLGASLFMGLSVLFLWGFASLIFGFDTGYVYALFGCIIFCGYILFDTWLIMGKLKPHEYVLAAILLYLDLINLFLFILRLLAARRR